MRMVELHDSSLGQRDYEPSFHGVSGPERARIRNAFWTTLLLRTLVRTYIETFPKG